MCTGYIDVVCFGEALAERYMACEELAVEAGAWVISLVLCFCYGQSLYKVVG